MNKTLKIQEEHKIFILAGSIFLATIIANLSMLYFSYKTYDGLVEENYYLKGLNYQENKNQIHIQEKLKWNVEIKKLDNDISILLKDKENQLIQGANIEINFFRPTQSGFDKIINLIEKEKGLYTAPSKLDLNKGIWDVFIKIKKNNQKWIKKERIFIN